MKSLIVILALLFTTPCLADSYQYVKRVRHSIGVVGGFSPNSVKLTSTGNVVDASIKHGRVIGAEYRVTASHVYTKIEVLSNYSVLVGAGFEIW